MNTPLAYSSVFLLVATLTIGLPIAAHEPSGHHETAPSAQKEEAMKALHARMGNFEDAMVALNNAVIRGDKTDAGKHAVRLTEALKGHEKDIPHKNFSRVKEFQAFYGEMKKRATKLAADAAGGNLRKTSLSYGRLLEVCASCHEKFRD